ncbi:MAG: AraC family transcriptional regulator [Clostridia bacterium]|nr:AraC family transcriptional regulator [Clostridia bacterium]
MKKFSLTDITVEKIDLAILWNETHKISVHRNRPFHGLAYLLTEKSHYRFDDGVEFDAERGNLIYLPKGSSYDVTMYERGECFAVNFEIAGEDTFPAEVRKIRATSHVEEAFSDLVHVWKRKSAGYKTQGMKDLYTILSTMRTESEISYFPKSKSEQIEKAVEYIHAEYANGAISIADLAAMSGVSEVYFRSIFLSTYGISPLKYINRLRFMRAKELLRSDFYSIAEIASLSGFSDEIYFSRAFKAETGVSPTEYRNKKDKV